jgi:hypothetical protein
MQAGTNSTPKAANYGCDYCIALVTQHPFTDIPLITIHDIIYME